MLYDYAQQHPGSYVKRKDFSRYRLYTHQTWYEHTLAIEYNAQGIPFEKNVTYEYKDDNLGQDFIYLICDENNPENILDLIIADEDDLFMPIIIMLLFFITFILVVSVIVYCK